MRSLITALSPSLPVLLLGWSVLEGVGAALIMPAIVALVASNFARSQRPRAYGLVAPAGAIAVAGRCRSGSPPWRQAYGCCRCR
jgi:MFS family permease